MQRFRRKNRRGEHVGYLRCAVRNREQSRAYAARNRERVNAAALAWSRTPEGRYYNARNLFARNCYERREMYARRAERHGTGGESIIPLRFLWHPVPVLVDFLVARFGDDLPELLREVGLSDVWQHTTRRDHVRFAKCDRICTRLGVSVERIESDPIFSVGPPQRREHLAA